MSQVASWFMGFLIPVLMIVVMMVLMINFFDVFIASMDWLFGAIEACCKFRETGQ